METILIGSAIFIALHYFFTQTNW